MNHHNNPTPEQKKPCVEQHEGKPVEGIFQKFKQFLFRIDADPRTTVWLACFFPVICSTHIGALAWFLLTFPVYTAVVYIFGYIRNCFIDKTFLTPWQFCRRLHLGEDCLSILKNHFLLLTVTTGLVMTNIHYQLLPPLLHPFFLGLGSGVLCTMLVTSAHINKRADHLLWRPKP